MQKIDYFSHHSFCFRGNEDTILQLKSAVSEQKGKDCISNTDYFEQRYETFTIDDARSIKAIHEMRPVNSIYKKIFIIYIQNITIEAQNALLKLLEEPADYAHFFIIIPSLHLLLPTVRSRVRIVENDKQIDDSLEKEAKNFSNLSKSKQIEFVKEMIEEIGKGKKEKQYAIDFLNSLQRIIYKEKGVKEGEKVLEAIELARKYIHDRAPSVKMLLEYVVLNEY